MQSETLPQNAEYRGAEEGVFFQGLNDFQTKESAVAQKPISAGPKIGRNDPCPCGSGKKYKKCHGK